MAFNAAMFKPLLGMSTSSLPRLFAYRTDDDSATVLGAGYFNALANELKVGDQIFSHVDAASVPSDSVIYYCRSNDGTTVVVQRAGE